MGGRRRQRLRLCSHTGCTNRRPCRSPNTVFRAPSALDGCQRRLGYSASRRVRPSRFAAIAPHHSRAEPNSGAPCHFYFAAQRRSARLPSPCRIALNASSSAAFEDLSSKPESKFSAWSSASLSQTRLRPENTGAGSNPSLTRASKVVGDNPQYSAAARRDKPRGAIPAGSVRAGLPVLGDAEGKAPAANAVPQSLVILASRPTALRLIRSSFCLAIQTRSAFV